VEGAYAATVTVEGPQRTALVDARASDALNLAVQTDAPVLAAPDVLAYCIDRQAGDSTEATLIRRALTANPIRIIGPADQPDDLRECPCRPGHAHQRPALDALISHPVVMLAADRR
jgi:hypothetical protein